MLEMINLQTVNFFGIWLFSSYSQMSSALLIYCSISQSCFLRGCLAEVLIQSTLMQCTNWNRRRGQCDHLAAALDLAL